MSERGIAIIRVPNPSDKDASAKAVNNLIKLARPNFDEIHLFEHGLHESGGVITNHIPKPATSNIILAAFYHLYFQIQLSKYLYENRSTIDVTLWHAGGFSLVIPLTISKAFGHSILTCVLGESKKGYENKSYWGWKRHIYGPMIAIIETFSYVVSDRIIIFTESLQDYLTLPYFKSKVRTLTYNFENVPGQVTPIEDRKYSIVYLGRVCHLKGADILADAIESLFINGNSQIRVVFVGDGNLQQDIEEQLANYNVEFTGWLDNDQAMEYVANSKLFVLPSRSEGLPKALTESMARGTVPIVTPVGNIPDIVTNGKNGILLQNQTPDNVARVIEQALTQDDLDRLSEMARNKISDDLSFASSQKTFTNILNEL